MVTDRQQQMLQEIRSLPTFSDPTLRDDDILQNINDVLSSGNRDRLSRMVTDLRTLDRFGDESIPDSAILSNVLDVVFGDVRQQDYRTSMPEFERSSRIGILRSDAERQETDWVDRLFKIRTYTDPKTGIEHEVQGAFPGQDMLKAGLRTLVGGLQHSAEKLVEALELTRDGEHTAAGLTATYGILVAPLSLLTAVTPVGQMWISGEQAIREAVPDSGELSDKIHTPFSTFGDELGRLDNPTRVASAQLADLVWQAALFAAGHRAVQGAKTKVQKGEPFSKSEKRVIEEAFNNLKDVAEGKPPKPGQKALTIEQLELLKIADDVGIPPTFKDGLIAQLGGKDAQTRFGKVGELTDSGLVLAAADANIPLKGMMAEAPIKQGGNIHDKGANTIAQMQQNLGGKDAMTKLGKKVSELTEQELVNLNIEKGRNYKRTETETRALKDLPQEKQTQVRAKVKNLPEHISGIVYRALDRINAQARQALREGIITEKQFDRWVAQRIRNLDQIDPVLESHLSVLTPKQKQRVRKEFSDIAKYFEEGYAENLRLGKFTVESRIEIAKQVRKQDPASLERQRRGKRTWKQTEEAAAQQTQIVRQAKEGKVEPGRALNAEQLEALSTELNRIAQKTPEEIMRTENPQHVANLIQTLFGARAEAGRGLQILSKTNSPELIRVFQRLEDSGIQKVLDDIQVKMRKGEKVPDGWDVLAEFGRNIKLATLSATVRTIVGQSGMQIMKYPEMVATTGWNKFLSSVLGVGRDRFLAEIPANVMGRIAGRKQKWSEAWRMLMEDPAAVADNAFLMGEVGRVGGAIPGTAGWVIRFPQRVQGALDVVYRVPEIGGIIGQYAIRHGWNQGLRSRALIEYARQKIENPPLDWLQQARTEARYWSLQNDLGAFGKAFGDIRHKQAVTQIYVPFFRTMANLFKYSVERSPLAPLTPSFQQAMIGAFAKSPKPIFNKWTQSTITKRYEQMLGRITGRKTAAEIGEFSTKMGRLTSGALFMSLTAQLFDKIMEGSFSGAGPTDAQERRALMNTGWQPYSIKVWNPATRQFYWVPYQGFEPWSSLIGAVANFLEGRRDEGGTKAGVQKALDNVGRAFLDNPFLTGISDIQGWLGDPTLEGDRASRMVASMVLGMTVPQIIQQSTAAIDGNMKDPDTVIENMRARIPWLSEGVPDRLDAFGQPIEHDFPAGRIFALRPRRETEDKLLLELGRLGIDMGVPSDVFRDIEIPREVHRELIQLAGGYTKIQLEALVNHPAWDRMTDGMKRDAILSIRNRTRGLFRLILMHREGLMNQAVVRDLDEWLKGGLISDEQRQKMINEFAIHLGVGENELKELLGR